LPECRKDATFVVVVGSNPTGRTLCRVRLSSDGATFHGVYRSAANGEQRVLWHPWAGTIFQWATGVQLQSTSKSSSVRHEQRLRAFVFSNAVFIANVLNTYQFFHVQQWIRLIQHWFVVRL